jgi:hypothetical protein
MCDLTLPFGYMFILTWQLYVFLAILSRHLIHHDPLLQIAFLQIIYSGLDNIVPSTFTYLSAQIACCDPCSRQPLIVTRQSRITELHHSRAGGSSKLQLSACGSQA